MKGVAIDGSGNLFFTDATNNQVFEISAGRTAPTALLATPTGLSAPTGVTVDGAGYVFVADTGNNRVVKLTGSAATAYVTSSLSISGAALNAPEGLATDGAGNLYVAGQRQWPDCTSFSDRCEQCFGNGFNGAARGGD